MSNEYDIAPPLHEPGGIRQLLYIALPIIVSQGCETAMMFVDRLFLSKLGPQYMSASMGGGLTVFMFMTFFLGLTGYASPLAAQYLGSGRKQYCARAVFQSVIIVILAYPVVLLCMPVGHLMFSAFRIAPEQLAPQKIYFNILMYGAIIGLLRHAVTTFFSGIGRTRIVMISAVAAMTVNVAANYVLIFGKLGFPALGITGAAIGTILGSATGLVITVVAFLGRTYRAEFAVLAALRFDWPVMKKLLRYGLPPGFEFLLNMIAFNLLIMSFHSYGVEVAAAVTIAFNWDLVAFVPMIGINIGITSLVGRFMGAGNLDAAHRATMSGLKVAVLYAAVMFALYLTIPHQLVGMFRPLDPETDFSRIASMAVFMVRLITVYVFGDAIALAFSGALRGAGDTFWTMVISIGGHWMLTLTALILVKGLDASPKTAWSIVVFLILGIGIAFYLRYRTGRWREFRVV